MVKKGTRKEKKTKRKLKMSREEKGRRRGGEGGRKEQSEGGGRVVMALVCESPRNTSTSEPLGEPFPRRPKD